MTTQKEDRSIYPLFDWSPGQKEDRSTYPLFDRSPFLTMTSQKEDRSTYDKLKLVVLSHVQVF